MPEEYEIADLTWRELETVTDETSPPLLPVGSTERHGLHLPVGVDTYMPEAITRRVAERSPCLLAPSIPYGVSPHFTFKPGTVTVENETFRHYVRDVCSSAGERASRTSGSSTATTSFRTPNSRPSFASPGPTTGCGRFAPRVSLFKDVAREIRETGFSFHASEFERSILSAVSV